MSRLSQLGSDLYDGKVSVDFVGRRKLWYIVSGIILIVAIGALGLRGLNLGIEFRGGAEFAVPKATCSVEQARTTVDGLVPGQAIVTATGNGTLRIQTESLTNEEAKPVVEALAKDCGVAAGDIKLQIVGPTWGGEISKKALQGLIVFLILVSIFLSIYFEWRMAVAALVALAHDLVITIGIYALTGLEVTPATVIGILTILGYSLYDTVVVFDKVKENTRGITAQSRLTYSDAANLAVNQTLVRSINTTLVALLPIVAIIVVGAGFLGAGTLLDLSVALGIGMAAGAYSSIFIATPFLAQLKERDKDMKSLAARVRARKASASAEVVVDAATGQTVAVAPKPSIRPTSSNKSRAQRKSSKKK